MKRMLKGFSIVAVFVLLGLPMLAQGFEIGIQVSPNVLNIQSEGEVVTVHTDIAYSRVSATTVTLNGVPIHHWKADNRGNFVAKFLMSAIKQLEGLHIGDYNELTLFGYTVDKLAFVGSDEIRVIDNVPAGRR